MTDAWDSMFGDGHANATRTRECVAMPGTRNQVVLTPACVLAPVRALWGRIAYDPCHGPGSLVGAERYTRTRGLLDIWPPYTFANVPYGKSMFDPKNETGPLRVETEIRKRAKMLGVPPKFPPGIPLKKAGLKHWIGFSMLCPEVIMLVPHRTNRKWYRQWANAQDVLIECDPLKYHGQIQAAPFCVAIGYRGNLEPGKVADAFAGLGDARW